MSSRESKEAPASPAAASTAEDAAMETLDDSNSATPAAAAAASTAAAAAAAAAATTAIAAPTTGGKAKGSKGAKRKAADDVPAEIDPCYEGQRFKLGELIYANYAEGKQWFEAKVLRVEKRAGLIYYYLHYQGWSDKFHDWRPYHHDNELHKHDEEGKRLMEDAKQKMREAKKNGGKGGGAAAAAAATDDAPKSGKKKGSKNAQDEDTVGDEVSVGGSAGEVRLKIPGYLKKQLINDWEQVTRGHKLVTLPRPQSVQSLLAEFEASKQRQESTHQMVKEVTAGIEQYFEKALGTVLLYRFERPQFKAQQAALDGKSLSSIYGAEHLLRLFVKLPSLLAYTKLDQKEAIVLGSKVNDLIKWLDKKAQGGTLFQQDYEVQEKEYVQTANKEEDN